MSKTQSARKINPQDIVLPPGFIIEAFAEGLDTPVDIAFSEKGEMFVADSGVTSGNGKVLKWNGKTFDLIAENFRPPVTGIAEHNGEIFVSHKGTVTVIKPDGTRTDILEGLPSYGDHSNNKIIIGPDGKLYFGQGTATNSGVVGEDNKNWVKRYPFFHDYPGADLQLVGRNFKTDDFLTPASGDFALTGAFSPFGVSTDENEIVKGNVKASGSILRMNPDGSELEIVAFGFRNPFRLKFDEDGTLYGTDEGMDARGSRPVANSPDSLYRIREGEWYGWPDYTAGEPVTMEKFRPEGGKQPEFLIANHPEEIPQPLSIFEPHSTPAGFDFAYNDAFGNDGDIYLAEFGSTSPETAEGKSSDEVGRRITKVNKKTGKTADFARNKSGKAASATGGGGFERPVTAVFDAKGDLYVADLGLAKEKTPILPGTGVIWRIRKE